MDSSHPRGVHCLRNLFKEETARAIMGAAEEVFAEQGLHAARMGEIASRAGVAVGTLYNYFKDREALLQGILDRRRAELSEKMDQCLAAQAGRPFREQLDGFLRVLLGHFEEHRRFFLLLMQGEQAQAAAALGKPHETLREVQQRIAELVRRGQEQGILRPDPEQLFASFLLGALRAVKLRDLTEESHAPLGDRAEQVAKFFLHGAGAGHG